MLISGLAVVILLNNVLLPTFGYPHKQTVIIFSLIEGKSLIFFLDSSKKVKSASLLSNNELVLPKNSFLALFISNMYFAFFILFKAILKKSFVLDLIHEIELNDFLSLSFEIVTSISS